MKKPQIHWRTADANNFIGTFAGYDIVLKPPFWTITLNGTLVDDNYHHPITKGEHASKKQIQAAMDVILKG